MVGPAPPNLLLLVAPPRHPPLLLGSPTTPQDGVRAKGRKCHRSSCALSLETRCEDELAGESLRHLSRSLPCRVGNAGTSASSADRSCFDVVTSYVARAWKQDSTN